MSIAAKRRSAMDDHALPRPVRARRVCARSLGIAPGILRLQIAFDRLGSFAVGQVFKGLKDSHKRQQHRRESRLSILGGVADHHRVAAAVQRDAIGPVVLAAAQHRAVAVAQLRGGRVPLQRGDKRVAQAGACLQRLLGREVGRRGLAGQRGRAAAVDGDTIAQLVVAAAQVGAVDPEIVATPPMLES